MGGMNLLLKYIVATEQLGGCFRKKGGESLKEKMGGFNWLEAKILPITDSSSPFTFKSTTTPPHHYNWTNNSSTHSSSPPNSYYFLLFNYITLLSSPFFFFFLSFLFTIIQNTIFYDYNSYRKKKSQINIWDNVHKLFKAET